MAYKFKWSDQEDSLLKFLKEEKKVKSWISIADQINQIQETRKRTPKQCRQRYINYVRLNNSNSQTSSEWSPLEQSQFQNLYMSHGPKWALIARQMKGRSQIFLKNRFYSGFRKITRKINSLEQLSKTSKKRLLKYENLLRIIEADKQMRNNQRRVEGNISQNQSFVSDLRQELLETVWSQDTIEDECLRKLIQKIHSFNSMFSYFGMRKVKFHCNLKGEDQLTENSSYKISNSEEVSGNIEAFEKVEQTISQPTSEKEGGQEKLADPCFDELLGIYEVMNPNDKNHGRVQDLEEELSFILKRDYIPDNLIYF